VLVQRMMIHSKYQLCDFWKYRKSSSCILPLHLRFNITKQCIRYLSWVVISQLRAKFKAASHWPRGRAVSHGSVTTGLVCSLRRPCKLIDPMQNKHKHNNLNYIRGYYTHVL
jgi:hypothetical protein